MHPGVYAGAKLKDVGGVAAATMVYERSRPGLIHPQLTLLDPGDF
jgi:hypothetical protein